MEFSIRHFISGRVRLHLPSLARKRKLAESALVWLEAQPGIKRARLNYDCACLVIEYDAKFEPVLRGSLPVGHGFRRRARNGFGGCIAHHALPRISVEWQT